LYKVLGSSSAAAQLAAFQEGVSLVDSTSLVKFDNQSPIVTHFSVYFSCYCLFQVSGSVLFWVANIMDDKRAVIVMFSVSRIFGWPLTNSKRSAQK
jgi:hypothetical protein